MAKAIRRASTRTQATTVAYYRGHNIEARLVLLPPQDDEPEDWMKHIRLIISVGTTSLSIPLTEMTLSELDEFGDVFELALEMSKPVSGVRDGIVAEAVENGDVGFSRYYRGVPNVVVPSGPFRSHLERIRQRRQGILPGSGRDGGVGELRTGGGGMAQQDEGEAPPERAASVGGEDDTAKAD